MDIKTVDIKYESKILTEEFLSKYKDKEPNWGFNGLGKVVYKRTYSRIKDDGNNEDWWETVARCVNGAQEIGANYSMEEAERLYDHVFNLRCNFAGRMLWQLGTGNWKRYGANAYLNCWGVQMNELEAFCFLFENSMLGGGVGYSVRREDIHELPKIKEGVKITHLQTKDAGFIVPDSREGWINILRKVLRSYFQTGKSFSYSSLLIRSYGEKINGFGGTASGPSILVDGITNICRIMEQRAGKKLRSIDVLDICNIIGSVVVAGNVRRSAQIAIGDPDDYLFIRAKRWDLYDVPNWRALSNNTIYADDFTHISNDIWEGYAGNGEAYGLYNLKLAQRTGRLGEPKKDNCQVVNPCFTGDTLVDTLYGKKSFIELLGKETLVYCYDGDKITISKMKNIRKTGTNQKVYKLTLDNGEVIKATSNHQFMLRNGSYRELKDLKIGDSLMPLAKLNDHRVEKIEFYGVEDVYDGEVEIYHNFALASGVIVHNCAEIPLANYEACNLCELYLNNIESKEILFDCSMLLYKTQKAICALPFLHEETNKIVHKNMRIGQGVTGICQSLDKLSWLDEAYKKLKEFDIQWSKKRDWNESIRITTVKPSGTLSLLAGATPGVHPAYSRYYIRRVRMASDDKLVEQCREAGYHVEYAENFDGTKDHKTAIVSFPCFAGDKAIVAKDMTAIKQLELVKQLQTVWADNAVSVTVYYKKEELPEIKKWLKDNYKESLKTVSFLLHNDHGFKQAPYEEITKEQYDNLSKDIKIFSNDILSGENLVDDCAGGACPIK